MKSKIIVWTIDGQVYECERVGYVECPACHHFGAIVALPPPLLARQPDGTTHVCAPFLGGCNQGYARTPAYLN